MKKNAQNKVSDSEGLKEDGTGNEGQGSDEELSICAKLCANHTMIKHDRGSGCCNFEWSFQEKKCKLYHDCVTSKPQNEDFLTCRKEGEGVFFWGGGGGGGGSARCFLGKTLLISLKAFFIREIKIQTHKATIVCPGSSFMMATSREEGKSRA